MAESCTAGLAAARLGAVPGISAALLAGVVAYSNESKTRLLGVEGELIERAGAVSAEVAASTSQETSESVLNAIPRR